MMFHNDMLSFFIIFQMNQKHCTKSKTQRKNITVKNPQKYKRKMIYIYKICICFLFFVAFLDITLYNECIEVETKETKREVARMIKVLGLGDNVVDKYMHIKTMYPGGNALNIAVLAKLFGIEAGYFGVFGDDEAARHVYQTVMELGLDVSHCRFYHGENGYAEVRLDDGDRVFIGSNQGGVSKENPISELTNIELDYIAEYDVCHTSIFSYVEEALPQIRKVSPFVSFDFSNRYDDDYLKRCCPYIDMAAISCGEMPKEEIVGQMEKIVSYGCRHIVMATRGSKGAFLMVDGKFYEQSPCLVEAKDTMAAGDSFITCFLINYLDGMKEAVDFSEKSGTRGVTTSAEYKDLLVKTSLYRAAVFAAGNCQRDGSFGFGKVFK